MGNTGSILLHCVGMLMRHHQFLFLLVSSHQDAHTGRPRYGDWVESRFPTNLIIRSTFWTTPATLKTPCGYYRVFRAEPDTKVSTGRYVESEKLRGLLYSLHYLGSLHSSFTSRTFGLHRQHSNVAVCTSNFVDFTLNGVLSKSKRTQTCPQVVM